MEINVVRKGIERYQVILEKFVINLYFSRDGMVITLLLIDRTISFFLHFSLMPLSIYTKKQTGAPKISISKDMKNEMTMSFFPFQSLSVALNRDEITIMESFYEQEFDFIRKYFLQLLQKKSRREREKKA
jgi:hypothetical protein